MAKKHFRKKKKAKITRRDLLKTAIASTIVLPVLTQKNAKAQLSNSTAFQQEYSFKMILQIPRIYSNEKSLGYRKYQSQTIIGKMFLDFDANGEICNAEFKDMVNKTHKMSNGKNVTYDAILDEDGYFPRFCAIGSNKTGKFNVASICFSLAAEPNYNIGEFDEDTSLYVACSGKGTFNARKKLSQAKGYVAGTLGCGCMAYGHISPTRTIGKDGPTENVTDVASVFGTWSMRLV